MGPKEVILETLDDRWSFEGEYLVLKDREGCHSRIARVTPKANSYPARIEYLDDILPEVIAISEAALRKALADLAHLGPYSRVFSPRP